jgi:hypothetical protein
MRVTSGTRGRTQLHEEAAPVSEECSKAHKGAGNPVGSAESASAFSTRHLRYALMGQLPRTSSNLRRDSSCLDYYKVDRIPEIFAAGA